MNQLSKEFLLIFFIGVIITVTPYTGSAFAFHGTPPTVNVTVEHIRINQMTAGRIYAEVSIEGENKRSPIVDGPNITPNWRFSVRLDDNFGAELIALDVYKDDGDNDPSNDQNYDIRPGPGFGLLLRMDYDPSHAVPDQDSCKLFAFSAVGNFNGRCGTTITVQGEDFPAAQISFRVDIMEPTSATDLQVSCIHDPIWPNVQAKVNIRARALDGNLAPRTVDSIEIWVNSQSGPVRTGSSVTELLHTVGPFASSFSYNCRVIDDGQTISTQWRRVFVGPQVQSSAVPVLYTGDRSSSIDIVFIADKDSYITAVTPNFENDVQRAIQAYYNEPNFLRNQDRINFWVAQDMGDARTNSCASQHPTNWDTDYTFANAGALLHRDNTITRECAPRGEKFFTATALPTTAPQLNRVIIHETGHYPFGLADEYCCDGGYWPGAPNLYSSLADCNGDPASAGSTCTQLSGTNPTTGAPMTLSWWTSDPSPNHLMDDNGQTQPLDSRRMNWMFNNCAAAGC